MAAFDPVTGARSRPPALDGKAAVESVIHRSRLADQAYEWIKQRILTGQLLPGQRLSVPAIAEELSLSRSPVREAVQRLVQEGMGAERPHQGAVVASADLRSLVDLYQVRAVLEGLSAELAADWQDPTFVEDLESIHRNQEHAVEHRTQADVIRADMRFHERILEAGANPALSRVLQPILHRMSLAMLAGEQSWPQQALTEHRAVLDAIRARDAAQARLTMAAHVSRVRDGLYAKLTEDQSPAAAGTGEDIA